MTSQMNVRQLERKLTNSEYYQSIKPRLQSKVTCACGATHQKRYTSTHLEKNSHKRGMLRKYFNALKEEEHIILSKPNLREQTEWDRLNKILEYSIQLEFRRLCSMYDGM